MPFVPLVEMGALVFCLVNFLKNLKAGLWSPVLTQLIAWVAGVLVVVFYAQTDWADKITFGDTALSSLNASSQIAIGLAASSIFGVVTQAIKALDTSDSAKTPEMIPGQSGP